MCAIRSALVNFGGGTSGHGLGIGVISLRMLRVRLRLSLQCATLCALALATNAARAEGTAEPLTIAVGPVLPPLLDRDADGHLSGFVIDFLTEAARRANFSVEFLYVPDREAMQKLDPERAPLSSWLLSEETMKGWVRFERSYLTLHTAIFRRRESVGKDEILATDLGELIAVNGSEAHYDLLDDGAIKIFTVPTIDDAVRLLASGQHDTIFANEMGVLDSIRRLHLDSIVEVAAPEMHMHQRLRLHRTESRADLEAALQPVLRDMRHDGAFDTAYTRWFGPLEPEENVSRRVFSLTVGLVALGGLLLGLVLFASRRRLGSLARGLGDDLRQSESRLGVLLEDVEAIVWEATPGGEFTYVSRYAEGLLGYAPELWLRPNFFQNVLLHPEDREATLHARRQATEKGQDYQLEYRAIASMGQVRWLNDVVHVVKSETGEAICLRGVMMDISARKESQDALRAGEARLAAIMDASPTGIFRLDLEGRVTFGNLEAARITGIEAGPIDQRRWLQAIHPEDRDEVVAAWRRVRDETVPDHREYRFVHADGEVVWVLDRGVPERDAAGRVIGFVGTLTDITQLKKAEETIRMDSAVLMSMAEGVGFTDRAGNILYTNAAFDAMYGYGPGELKGQPVSVLSNRTGAETARKTQLIMDQLRQTGRWDGDLASRRKDGTPIAVRARMSRVDGHGEAFAVSVQEDVTEARQLQEALRTSEEKFRRVAESAMVGIAMTDQGQFTFSNNAMIELAGYTPEELNSLDRMQITQLLLGDEVQADAYAALLRLDSADNCVDPVVIEEARIRHKNGTDRWARVTLSRLYPEQPFPRLFLAVDITARKLAEDALKESEEKFRRVAETAFVGIALHDGTRYTYLNQALRDLVGYRVEDLDRAERTRVADILFDDTDRARVLTALAALDAEVEQQPALALENVRMYHRDGSHRWVSLRFSRLSAGRPFPRLTVCVDVTQRKLSEDALRASEDTLRHTQRIARVGGWDVDLRTNAVTWSEEARRIYEVPDDFSPSITSVFQFYPEAMRKTIIEIGEAAKLDGAARFTESEITTFKGTKKWLRISIQALLQGGEAVRLTGAIQDISDLKRVEISLRESEQRLRAIVESEPECVKLLDQTGALLDMNPAGLAVIEAETIEEVRGRDVSSLVAPEYREIFCQSLKDIFAGKPTHIEFEIMGLKGARRWMDQSAVPLWDTDRPGHVKQMLAVARDVTGRKQMEEALRVSEALFRAISEQIPDSLMLLNVADPRVPWRIDYANEAAARLHGVPLHDLVGQSVLSFIANPPKQGAPSGLDALRAGKTLQFETELRRQDGSVFPAEIMTRALPALGPDIALSLGRDISARRKAEAALRESEALFRAISEQMPDSLLLLDLDDPELPGRIRYANEAAARMHGMTLEELVGKPISALDAPDTAQHVPERIRRLRAGETIYFEGEHVRKDGSVFPVDVVARKIPALGGSVVLAIDRDITERREAEKEHRRIEARMQQAQRLESLGVLAGGIAHDFNNLLGGILGHADLAREDAPASGPLRESIEQIQIAARRAADLVHQMLAYSGRGNFVVRRVRLGEMVRELTKLLEITLSKKATLVYEIDDSAPPIGADGAQIQQVVMNLITNASDALGDQPGAITLRSGTVEYTADALRAYAPHQPPQPGLFVFLEVSDTGCGMDAETLDRIFDPFFSTKFTGRGLGLAAALGIIRGHHGGLRVTSRVGHGTTFRVILPATGPENDPAALAPAAAPAHSRAGTLLVVDDEPRVRDFLVRALQRLGHEVLVATDGRQALEVYDRHRDNIDAVLLDITMPEMGGGDVLQSLRARDPELPVTLMSGFTEAETRSQLENTGYSGFLQKPFSLDALRAAVDALLVRK